MSTRGVFREPDQEAIATFVHAVFPYADDGTFVSLRAFDQFDRGKPPPYIRSVSINGLGLDAVVAEAIKGARFAANATDPSVFAPPIATFNSATRAAEDTLANGVCISVEIDQGNTAKACQMLEALLGPATVVVASGGECSDPETGELHSKIHVHWRLSEPTREPDEHAKLKHARCLACALVDADPTAKTSVHPLRWPGSWHLKASPKLARIVKLNADREVHLVEALETLEGAIAAAGLKVDRGGSKASGKPRAPIDLIVSALAKIPNAPGPVPGCDHWNCWIEIGLLTYRASGGSKDGLEAWRAWSAKSAKHDDRACDERWDHFAKSPPSRGGAGTLFYRAKRHGWQRPTTGGANKPETSDDIVAEFNAKYMVVNEAGKVMVYAPGIDRILNRRQLDRLSFDDFRRLYMNRRVQVGTNAAGSPIVKTAADVWLNHPKRRQYLNGVVFDPSAKGASDGVLNLWKGFAVEPAPGDWSLLRQHIAQNICDGDEKCFNYLMGWMARIFQLPAEQGEVAVVLKGGEGTGKGTLAKILLKIIGHHGFAINNGKHLVGNFNGHLRDTIFLFADEAFFAGDRAHIGTLKSIITEPHLMIEAKYQNPVPSANHLHLMMASNEEWVVPAALDARRFLVLEVSEKVKNNHAYFGEIWAQMEAGGYAAMLHDLLAMHLTAFNVRAVPVTVGLQEQRKLSLSIPDAWWRDCLERSYVFQSQLGLEELFGKWHEVVSTELLFTSYTKYARAHGERRLMSREALGKFMRRMMGRARRPSDAYVGEHLVDEFNGVGGTQRKAKPITKARPPAFALGTIEGARDAFSKVTGLAIEWEAEDGEP
jgi:Family of unknown function (DUF5906)/Primase C terminal 2 (PriCT-2)